MVDAAEGRALTLLAYPQPLREHLATFGLGGGLIQAGTYPKAINNNADRVRKLHASLADYDPSQAWLHLGVALHAGAERYYREKGWLR